MKNTNFSLPEKTKNTDRPARQVGIEVEISDIPLSKIVCLSNMDFVRSPSLLFRMHIASVIKGLFV